MKYMILLIVNLLLFSCNETNVNKNSIQNINHINRQENKAIQEILDRAKLNGAILIFDKEANLYYSNNFSWVQQGHLPASTYKIPHSIIAIETSVVENDSSLLQWDGSNRRLEIWEQDLLFKDAFKYSCVPCYQDVARKIGNKRMNEYLAKLDFGNMDIHSENVDNFWLVGKSRITQRQQIDFLQRLYYNQLPISDRTHATLKRMMYLEEKETFRISGKTGWSITEDKNNGWFVGYLEIGSKVYFFATNIEPKDTFNMTEFPTIRKQVTVSAFEELGIIEYFERN